MLSQSFGDRPGRAQEELADADIISAVAFDDTGEYLATGDKNGRVVIFQRTTEAEDGGDGNGGSRDGAEDDLDADLDGLISTTKAVRGRTQSMEAADMAEACVNAGKKPSSSEEGTTVTPFSSSSSSPDSGEFTARMPQYRFLAEFQSHEAEFDYLKSLEIEEKINQIRWCRGSNNALFLLTTNDKTIKLWKVFEKKIRRASTISMTDPNSLQLPRSVVSGSVVTASPRRIFANAHAYHINSISLNSDGETFISADDLRINWWSHEITNRCFNIVDIKPANMEELTEVITASQFHPSHCHVMCWSTSRGTIKLGDTRQSALCDSGAKSLEEAEDDGMPKSFFSEIIASISDVQFLQDGRYILARDYLTVKVWDVNMESRPVRVFNIHDHLRGRLCDLYENDCIFDKFECAVSPDGERFITGSYDNFVHVFDRNSRTGDPYCVELSNSLPPKKIAPQAAALMGYPPSVLAENGATNGGSNKPFKSRRRGTSSEPAIPEPPTGDSINFGKKVLQVAWHPHLNLTAIAGQEKLYLYAV